MLDQTCDRLDVWRPGQAQVFGIMAYDRRMAIWPFLGGSMAKSAAILLTGSSPAAAGPAVLLGQGRPLLRRLLGSGSSGLLPGAVAR